MLLWPQHKQEIKKNIVDDYHSQLYLALGLVLSRSDRIDILNSVFIAIKNFRTTRKCWYFEKNRRVVEQKVLKTCYSWNSRLKCMQQNFFICFIRSSCCFFSVLMYKYKHGLTPITVSHLFVRKDPTPSFRNNDFVSPRFNTARFCKPAFY